MKRSRLLIKMLTARTNSGITRNSTRISTAKNSRKVKRIPSIRLTFFKKPKPFKELSRRISDSIRASGRRRIKATAAPNRNGVTIPKKVPTPPAIISR